jgi:hypothetical protein
LGIFDGKPVSFLSLRSKRARSQAGIRTTILCTKSSHLLENSLLLRIVLVILENPIHKVVMKLKRKTVAFTTILFTFIGFGWLIESQDRFNRGIFETDDPATANLQPVGYEGIEGEEELPVHNERIRQPFKSREYIRIVPNRTSQTNQAID